MSQRRKVSFPLLSYRLNLAFAYFFLFLPLPHLLGLSLPVCASVGNKGKQRRELRISFLWQVVNSPNEEMKR